MKTKTIIDKVMAGVAKKQISNAVEETEKKLYDQMQEFVETNRYLQETIETILSGNKTYMPAADESILYGFKESYESFKKTKESVKITEALWQASGGGYHNMGDAEYFFFVRSARDKVKFSPFLRNIRNQIINNILPTKLRIDIPNDMIDEHIEVNVLQKNNFNSRLKQWIDTTFVDAELFPILFFKDKQVKIRHIDPLEVTEIYRHSQDAETILGYKREYEIGNYKSETVFYKDAEVDLASDPFLNNETLDGNPKIEEGLVLYIKEGSRVLERGELALLPALRWDRILEEIILDLARLYHERAKVIWILKIKGSTKDSVLDRSDKPLRGGIVKIETDNREWRIESSKLNDHTSREYAMPIKSALAASVGIPVHTVFMDSAGQGYSNLRASNSPTNQMLKSRAGFWADNIERLIRVVLKKQVAMGALPQTVTISKLPAQEEAAINNEINNIVSAASLNENYDVNSALDHLKDTCISLSEKKQKIKVKTVDLPITIIFPQQDTDNPLLLAQALNVLVATGIMSKRTARKRLGLEPDVEMGLISQELMLEPEAEPIAKNQQNGVPSAVSKTGKTEQPATNYDRKLKNDKVK